VKDFLRWHATISQGKIMKVVISDPLNTIAEWFFASFSRGTGTPTHEDDRNEVYNVSILYRTWRALQFYPY
jgi:hypothetical protein